MKKESKKRKEKGFLDWLVETFRPGCHIAKNPPKGKKRVKRILPSVEEAKQGVLV